MQSRPPRPAAAGMEVLEFSLVNIINQVNVDEYG
jgi:hypothetical protein